MGRGEIASLVAQLGAGESSLRAKAAESLGELRAVCAIPHLFAAMREDNVSLTRAAGDALSLMGKPAVPQLIGGLSDEFWAVRYHCACALGELRDAAAVEQLIAALGDGSMLVRGAAAKSLGQIKDARAIPHLINLLSDEQNGREAAVSLFRMGRPAMRELINYANIASWPPEKTPCPVATRAIVFALKKGPPEWRKDGEYDAVFGRKPGGAAELILLHRVLRCTEELRKSGKASEEEASSLRETYSRWYEFLRGRCEGEHASMKIPPERAPTRRKKRLNPMQARMATGGRK